MGRTGRLFAHEWAGVTPDIMMVAKGIGGGFPLGAVLATEDAASGMTAGTHGSTYGGNPLGCAVGIAVMEIVADPAFLAEVNRKAGALRQKLEGLVAAHPDVFEGVRGQGLMLGLEMRRRRTPTWSRPATTRRSSPSPAADNVIRLLPAAHHHRGRDRRGDRPPRRAAADQRWKAPPDRPSIFSGKISRGSGGRSPRVRLRPKKSQIA